MFKIWAKTMRDNKIIQDQIYCNDGKYSEEDFLTYMTDICYKFDIPTPLILKCHKHNFENFNIAKFRVEDFVESVNFDMLVIENATD